MLCKEVLVCSVLFLAHMMMAFPSGAPTGGACGTRRPIHGNNTVSEGTSSYIILVDRPIVRAIRTFDIISGRALAPSAVQGNYSNKLFNLRRQ